MDALNLLRKHSACSEAMKWVKAQPDKSAEALWSTCERTDWMLWIACSLGVCRSNGTPRTSAQPRRSA